MATFDDAALSSLTEKINQKLAGRSGPKTEPPAKNGKQNKRDQSDRQNKPQAKRKQQDDKVERPAKKQRDNDRKSLGKKHRDNDQKPAAKKRLEGTQKPNSKKQRDNSQKPNGKPEKSKDGKAEPSAPLPQGALLDEIRLLGGDERDLELIEDVLSDDEGLDGQKSQAKTEKGFAAELARFASELGFEKVKPEEVEEEDEAQDEEHVEEEDYGEEVEDDDEDEEVFAEEVREPSNNTAAKEPKQSAEAISKGKRKTIFEPRPDWHAVALKPLPEPKSDDTTVHLSALTSLKQYARTLLEDDSAIYSTTLSSSSSHKFMSTIMTSGTISDKTSALTLAIQESPVHNTKSLNNLIGLAAKRSRGPALSASAALVDLLGPGSILPSDRRLRQFTSQPGLVGTLQKTGVKSWSLTQALPGKITKEHLISWAFEDWLKEAYFKVIQALEIWCDDEVEYSRLKAVDMVFALLKEKPEQEANLLRLIVTKLGDRERKIASRASYLLLQLLNIHPGMKAVVVKTVEQEVIFRQGQNIRAKYYAINTLNQTILSSKEPHIADSLLRIYFGMFVGLLKSGELGNFDGSAEEVKSKIDKRKKRRASGFSRREEAPSQPGSSDRDSAEKLTSAILTGINRAVPFSEADHSTLETHLNTLFRITHSSNFNTSIQALMLIQQLSSARHLATERFSRTLYESLLDPRLATSSKQALYLNLLYRALKSDVDVRRVKAFVKRMLQILSLHQPSFVCGIIYLTMELYVTFPDLKTLLSDPEEHDEILGVEEEAEGQEFNAEAGHAKGAYDGRKRDPEYSNAHRSCLWELLPFLRHFHPSVDLYAASLLEGKKPAQKPDLANHTLIHFLDKFVYRNPKTTETGKGQSLMQPLVASGSSSVLLSNNKSVAKTAALNSAAFWNKKVDDVAVEDVFFHEYFSQVGKPAQAERQKKKTEKTADDDEAESDEDEDEIWEALKSSRPEVDGGESESELGSDFDELMDDGSDLDMDTGDEDVEGMEFSDVSSLDFGDEDDDEEEGKGENQEDKPVSENNKRRKMLKGLPTFASAEDYADMLADEEDGM